MLQNFQSAIKKRVIAVFLLVHLGLAIAVYALARNSALMGWDQTSTLFLAAILCLYLGFVLGVFFVVAPILPWLNRAKQVEHWTQRLSSDLPVFLEQLPKIIAAVESLIAVWNESRRKAESQTR